MRQILTVTASIGLLLALGACSFIDMARYTTAEFTARVVVAQCMLSPQQRYSNLMAVNGWLAANGRQARALAFDCNGDGAPDWTP